MASAGLQKLFDELKAVVLEADEVLGRAGEAAAPAIGEAVEAVGAAEAELSEDAPTAVDRLRASAGRAADSTADFIREHPWQALGVAAAAGFLVGWLVKRK